MPLIVKCFYMPKKRKQNYQQCPWCTKRGKKPASYARLTALERHMAKCEAAFLLENARCAMVPTRDVMFQMILRQNEEIGTLRARMTRLEERRVRVPKLRTLTPKECWEQRRDLLRVVHKHFGEKKFNFWLDATNICDATCLATVLFPVLQMRGGKLCFKGIITEDIYCLAKQLWGKNSTDVDLEWWKEVCEGEFGQEIDTATFNEANERLMLAYQRFQACPVRMAGNQAPQGLVRMKRLWSRLASSFQGYEDELYGEGIDLLNPGENSTEDSLQSN